MPPVVALAGAAFSVSAGLAAAGTLAAGITAAGVMGGMMVAGGALTALGTVTGNKRLSKIGGTLSLVGGVGQLATGLVNGAATAGSAATGTAGSAATGAGGMSAEQLAIAQQLSPADAASLMSDAASTSSSAASTMSKPGGLLRGIMDTPVGQEAASWGAKAKQGVEALSSWAQKNPQAAIQASGIVQGAAGAYAQPKAAAAATREQQRLQDLVRQRYSDSVRNLVIPSLSPQAPIKPGGLINGFGG